MKKFTVKQLESQLHFAETDLDVLKRTLPFLALNPQYDDGSNQRAIKRREAEITRLTAKIAELKEGGR